MSNFEQSLENILNSGVLPPDPIASTTNLPNITSGQKIEGQIEIDGTLGGHELTRVFSGHDYVTGDLVAAKFFAEPNVATKRRVATELGVHKLLEDFQQILPLHSMGAHGDYRVLITQRADTTLDQLVTASVEDVETMLPIIGDAVEGVGILHRYGLVHRDIKPENVFVVNGEGQLGDFGVVIDRNSFLYPDIPLSPDVIGQGVTNATTLSGTVGFIAPESAKAGIFDTKTDVFALGALMYKVFTGKTTGEVTSSEREMTLNEYQTRLLSETRPHITSENRSVPTVIGDLALSCVAINAVDRPSINDIRAVIASV